jgi:hypothetical protein
MVRGIGGILEPEEAYALLERNLCNTDSIFPYLNGTYLASHAPTESMGDLLPQLEPGAGTTRSRRPADS